MSTYNPSTPGLVPEASSAKMYIKSMVVDGFKSYGQRTEIAGFDPAFNAITGLNGSGKSNILDAICFLLGITNLSHVSFARVLVPIICQKYNLTCNPQGSIFSFQVRATNLQELVYKNGQAGVTKATVTITFDNRDKKQSPLGYDHFDELSITRQVRMAALQSTGFTTSSCRWSSGGRTNT